MTPVIWDSIYGSWCPGLPFVWSGFLSYDMKHGIISNWELTIPSWDTGSCDGLVICWFSIKRKGHDRLNN